MQKFYLSHLGNSKFFFLSISFFFYQICFCHSQTKKRFFPYVKKQQTNVFFLLSLFNVPKLNSSFSVIFIFFLLLISMGPIISSMLPFLEHLVGKKRRKENDWRGSSNGEKNTRVKRRKKRSGAKQKREINEKCSRAFFLSFSFLPKDKGKKQES